MIKLKLSNIPQPFKLKLVKNPSSINLKCNFQFPEVKPGEYQEKYVVPLEERQEIIPDKEYDALSKVVVYSIPEEYIIPRGELGISENGVHNVRDFETTRVEIHPRLQYKYVTPSKEFQTIEPDSGYDGLMVVDVYPIPPEYSIPQGTIDLYENGTYNVVDFAEARVQFTPNLQYKAVTPKKETQVIGPDKGYDGLAIVDIGPVTSNIDKNIVSENIRDGVEILGVQGTLKSEGAKYAPQYISWRQQDATDLTYEVSNIDSSRIISCMRMFDTCSNLTSLDLSSWTLESCNRLGYMFYNSTKLKSINMSNFDTRNVIYMNSMFYQCKALPSVDISHFNPKSLTNVNAMFQNCTALTEVDISSICTTKINNSALMFSGCTKLTKVIIDSPNVFPMTNVSFFTNTPIANGTGYVYVPDNLKETYQKRTNWTTYASQIKGMSELV